MRFPKQRRLVDEAALDAYRVDHPVCEVLHCPVPPMKTPHHLVPRSRGGPDVGTNLISLCVIHHTGNEGWHPLGGYRWFQRFETRLHPDAAAKVRIALRL